MIAQPTHMLHYLIELRKRLLICLAALAIIFFVLFYFANDLYTWFAWPLLKKLPHGQGFIATQVTAPFLVPFQLAWTAALFLAVPVFLYQVWSFVAPALYSHERKFIWPLLFLSSFLFYLGVAFAYFIIFPTIFSFLTKAAPHSVMLIPDIGQYYDFSVKLLFLFGMIFEVPVITVLFIWMRILTPEKLAEWRPYIIVGAFVLGMFFTPDVISQTLVALPLWLLFEVGLLFARFFVGRLNTLK